MKILIVGYGNIGKHIYKELEKLNPDIYDKYIPKYRNTIKNHYDIAFICVPTDMSKDESVNISIVDEVISLVKANVIVIKSAIPPGTTDMLIKKYNKNIVISPEYYGTTQHSPDLPDFLILGGERHLCDKVSQVFYKVKDASFRIRYTNTTTAELAKYMENCFLALKVTFCNEFADIAKGFDISYPELRELFILDKRMGDSHTFVYDDKPYYDSHCLNKDIPGMIKFAKSRSIEVPLMSSVHKINLNIKKHKALMPYIYHGGNHGNR